MSDFEDLYGGRFLSSQDVKAPTNVTSDRIEQESFTRPGEPTRTKAVLYFRGGKKGMVINKTNANVLAAAFGKNLSDWADKRMTIKSEPTNFGGKPTQGLRLYPITAAAAPPKPPKDDLNDEIPW
jgi:hypothetical protein